MLETNEGVSFCAVTNYHYWKSVYRGSLGGT